MTTPLYEVGIIAVDGDDRVGEFTGCIQKLVADTIGGTTFARLAVSPVEEMKLKGPAVALVLWDESLMEGHLESLARLHASDITVIPVVNSLDTMPHLLAGLAELNAVGWDRGSTPIARMCLRELGLFESARNVFISHRRSDGLLAAERLYEALSKAGWRPFVDRFGIGAGALFQERIEEALEECAFVLLLETPDASTSEWVQHEVLFALERSLGVTIANIGNAPHFPGTQGIPRTVFAHPFERNGSHIVLSDVAVSDIVELVEAEHAAALVRRRRQLLVSAMAAARMSGLEARPEAGWRLRVTQPDERDEIVGVVPHLPLALDLYDLGQAAGVAATAVLVHAAHVLGDRRSALLRWVIAERPIEMVPNNAIGARWAGHE